MTKSTHRIALLCATATLGLSCAAQAQETPAADDTSGEYAGNEIIVTATKREQTLQDVPVAVSVTTAQTLERAQIRDIKDLGTVVPSLRVGERQNSASTNFFIRGFGNGANNAGIEPSVGVFIDGVYRSRSAAQIADFPDVARVEVLRGPQSTLFGKNASAGVISIVTEKPKFEFGGNVEASYGNYDAVVVKGVVTGPVSDTLALSLAGGINKRDGYNRNLATGGRTNDRDRWFVRGQALFEPTDALRVRLIGDYGKIDETCCAVVNLRTGARTGILTSLGGQVNTPAQAFDNIVYTNFDSTNRIKNYGVSGQIDYETGLVTLTSITAWRKSVARAYFDPDFTSADLLRGANIGYTNIETFTQELRATTSIGDKLDLLVGGFYFNEKVRQETHLDWGTAARPYFDRIVRAATANAFNIGGGGATSDLERIFGGLEAQAAADPALAGRYVGQFFVPGQGIDENDRLKNENFSIFGQADYKITDRLTLTGGIAYTQDKKRFAVNIASDDVFAALNFNAAAYRPFRNQLLVAGALAQGLTLPQAQAYANANDNNPAVNPLNVLRPLQIFAPFVPIPNEVEPGRTSDNKFTYTARLAFDATDTVNVYASYATGYKASSIALSRDSKPLASDFAALSAAGRLPPNQIPGTRFAGPENSTVYELGLKGNWGVATANLAVFHQAIKGFQSNLFTGLGFELRNAGKQSVFGIEFEGSVKPTPGLTLGLAMTYLDPKYDDFRFSAVGDLSGTTPADIPPISATFMAEYEHRLANDDRIILRGSYHYESEVQVVEGLPAFADPSLGGDPIGPARPYKRQVDEVDASLTYAMGNGIELTAWGRNLLNDRYISVVFDAPAQAGSVSGYTNQPRTYGVAARYRW